MLTLENLAGLAARPVPYAVLGAPVGHSLSPAMQQAAFDHLGLEARYHKLEVDEAGLDAAVAALRRVPFGGWNCTVPNKVRMLELCDRLAPGAARFRAVNTVVNEAGALVGHNTDGLGWSRALTEAFGVKPGEVRILLLGAGGAGRAIATQALLEKCPRLVVANRTVARAEELLREIGAPAGEPDRVRAVSFAPEELRRALAESDLVVNATAAGLDAAAPPVLAAEQIGLMPGTRLVFDTIYGAGTAKLRREATAAGARWSDGLGMLLHQGAEAFSLWTGQDAPLEVMRAALRRAAVA